MRYLLFLITLCCWSLNAATYYVSTTGNSSWNGQAPVYVSGTTGPKRTILQGIQLLSPGDTLELRGGIYEEPGIDLPPSINGNSDAARTIIKSYSGERAIFKPTSVDKHGIASITSSSIVSNMTFDGWTIDFGLKDIELQGRPSIANLKFYWTTNFTMTNMHFINNTNGQLTQIYSGTRLDTHGPGGNILVTSCTFSNVHRKALSDGHLHDPCHPMYWSVLRDVTIENNLFINGHSYAVHNWGGQIRTTNWVVRNNWMQNFGNATYLNSENSFVYNNVMVNITGVALGQGSRKTLYANNTVWSSSGRHGIWSTGYDDDFVNNIIWGEWTKGIMTFGTSARLNAFTNNIAPSADWSLGSPIYENRGNLIGSTHNPLFANTPTNFTLLTGSPAIKTGSDLSSLFIDDYTGSTRVTPWDRGAYASEYDEADPPVEPPAGDDIYVSTTGNNTTGTGTFANPYRTIAKGIEVLPSGGTLVLRGGIYQEPGISIASSKSGSGNSTRTTIQSYTGERAIFQPTTHTQHGLYAANSTVRLSNFTFSSFTIDRQLKDIESQGESSYTCLKFFWVTNITFTNMHFVNNTNSSLTQIYPGVGLDNGWGPGGNVRVVDCLFSNVYNTPLLSGHTFDPSHPIYWNTLQNVIIENNRFYNGHARAINCWVTPGSPGGRATNWVVRNNLIDNFSYGTYFNTKDSYFYNNVLRNISNTGFGEGSRDALYANNTVYSTGGSYGIHAQGYSDDFVNNLVWGKWANGIITWQSESSPIRYNTFTNNIAPSANFTQGGPILSGNMIGSQYDPQFHGAPNDLTIPSTSPAAGVGVNLSPVFTTDINGDFRDAWDVGAYRAAGKTIYASPSGSDSGAGTLASPYRTIKKGIEMLQAGGTLVLRGGDYVEASLAGDVIKSGPSPTQRTIVKSYPGERAVFKPTHHGAGSSLTTHAIGANRIKSNIVFDSWTIDTSLRLGDGINVAEGDVIKIPAHNFMLTNMWFLNHPWGSGVVWSRDGLYPVSNMYSWSSNTHVVSCTFSNWNTAIEKWGHPIYMLCWWKSIVENNLFVEGDKVAIQYSSIGTNLTSSDVVIRGNRIIAGPTKRFSNGIYNNSNISTNVWIYNNTIDVKQWGIYLMGRTNHVYNNTIYYATPSSEGVGIYLATGGPNYIANNIVWGIQTNSSANTILSGANATARLTNNIAGPKLPNLTAGNIIQSSPFYGPAFDPLFTSAPTDLRISNAGAAAGTGVNLGSVFNTDITGILRQEWDIGAYAVGSQGGDDDPEDPPPVITYPRVSVVQYGPAYEKDSTTATFVIFRDNYTDDLDVNYTLTGTAVENTNFTISPSSPATIAAGQNSVTITVTPIDTQYIGALTVILTLDEDASYTLSSPSSATMEILGSGQAVSGFRRTFGGGPVLIRKKL